MIEIKDKKNCTGCGACRAICPKGAIILAEDEEGFRYPKVNQNLCVDCGICDISCPMLNCKYETERNHEYYESQFFAGQLVDRQTLFSVSSGGAFWAFALAMIDEEAVIYGAVQKNVDYVYHDRAESVVSAESFKRSKYFQSDVLNSYEKAKEDLEKGRNVLFSGTPCQIAGLKSFLKKDYEKLVTIEVVCHGVPSKKVFSSYRNELEMKYGRRITDIIFRDKSKGWSHNQYKIAFEDGNVQTERSTINRFHLGYLLGLFNRPSCGNCPFSTQHRVADITLADYWKYRGKYTEQYGDLGVSLIVINSDKGEKLLRRSLPYLDIEKTDKEQALYSCRHFSKHPEASPFRDKFLRDVLKNGYHHAASKYFLSGIIRFVVSKRIQRISKMFGFTK